MEIFTLIPLLRIACVEKTKSMESKKANCLSLLHYPGLRPPLLKEGELDPDDACEGNADMRCRSGVNGRP